MYDLRSKNFGFKYGVLFTPLHPVLLGQV